ncbi:type II toxin-antitoxin system RatA family toxin [Marinicella litoralis]|uniref:Ribosome-associated toxin RatA of RatAB toxin-antitoxin module n=1 Tax=Marinicella litoralis TaxID=644220 RepID=A0A4R6XLF7_9GAMM|nr:type II toxin-antitoxin system RatA family toxin [Marinicella litoralis]TDR18417.1 ribosome-associated toxin RatA of RatAB toxin-antitoxin module [Marinicella litoralis]
MAEIIKSAIVPHASSQMLSLVNAIEDYPQFLKWCQTGFVKEKFNNGYIAGMQINIKGIEVEFVTRNEIQYDNNYINLYMTLVSGPFKQLSGQWQFHQFPEFGSKVELQLSYEVKSKLIGKIFSKGFDQLASGLVNDFVNRAGVIYAKS